MGLTDWQAVLLTFKLALVTTILLLFVGGAIALGLSKIRSPLKPILSSFVALPLVLPPTVMGFYLLLMMSNSGPLGWLGDLLGFGQLTFTFSGVVIASMIYSLPFAVQPMQQGFESIQASQYELSSVLGLSSFWQFVLVTLPQAKKSILLSCVMVFAHTLGEFGVVLMVGGSLPGETRVVSIAIYDQVESLNYAAAHTLSLIMLGAAFFLLWLVYFLQHKSRLDR
jgi:molybdate transport system permease protein